MLFVNTDLQIRWYHIPMVSRSQDRLIFSFKQLSCLQTIFITCNGLFGFELFFLISGPLTKYPNIDFRAINVQLLLRFISPVTIPGIYGILLINRY